MHPSSYRKMQSFIEKYLSTSCLEKIKIIDLGGMDVGYGTYKPLFNNPKFEYFGCDLNSGKNVDIVIKNQYRWDEIKDEEFDVLISGQTFEHIEYPWLTMIEISRILKTDGICCIIAPSSGPEHKYPLDCWRFYPDGFSALAKFVQLEILEVFTDWKAKKWGDSVLIAKKVKNQKYVVKSIMEFLPHE